MPRQKDALWAYRGGIDSALVVSLCAKAFPNNTIGIVMPIDSMMHWSWWY
nr:hypothetical protein [Mycoplasmopsis bovis]